jgi:phage repressor protein C with HTH and peptisase S24 domain
MKKDSRRLPLTDWQIADSDRLKALYQAKRADLKLTQDKMAEGLGAGVTQGAVSHFMNRRTALSLKAVAVFAKLLEVPVSDISPTLAKQMVEMGIITPPQEVAGQNAPAANTPLPDGDETDLEHLYAFVPQLTAKAAAGLGHDNPHVESRSTLAFKREWLRYRGANPKNLMVIYADGDSMWPTISHQDVLLVDKSRVEPIDRQVFVLASAEGAIVKRLVQGALGGWVIRSDNEDKEEHPDRLLLRSDVNEHRIIGQVIWRGGDL